MEVVPFAVVEDLALQVYLVREEVEWEFEVLAAGPMKAVEEKMEGQCHTMTRRQKTVERLSDGSGLA